MIVSPEVAKNIRKPPVWLIGSGEAIGYRENGRDITTSAGAQSAPIAFRRISRHEFVHSVNDLLGTDLDLADQIPEDRGTNDFDSNRRIQLSREMLGAYFSVADEMLEYALPSKGFTEEGIWVTNKVKDVGQIRLKE